MLFRSAGGRELGHVLFVQHGEYLMPQDLEVDERYRGQGIAQTMYDYVKSRGYKIRRSGQQTAAGAGFWDKHRPGQNVWEHGVTEDSKEINWVNPDFDREYDEVEWQLEHGKGKIPQDVLDYYTQYFPTKQAWLKAVQNGKPVTIPVNFGQEIRNNTENKKDWLNEIGRAHV